MAVTCDSYSIAVIQENYSKLSEIFNDISPDIVFHLAAESHVDRSIDNPLNFINSNILGTYNLIESVRKYLKHYGQISKFNEAYMDKINNKYMKINYDGKSKIIYFKNEISEEEIHSTLVNMIREI